MTCSPISLSECRRPKGNGEGQIGRKFPSLGKTGDPDAIVERRNFPADGRVQQYRLLVLLGQILQIEELQELQLEQADAKYHLRPG